jgi:hypothetical protein
LYHISWLHITSRVDIGHEISECKCALCLILAIVMLIDLKLF